MHKVVYVLSIILQNAEHLDTLYGQFSLHYLYNNVHAVFSIDYLKIVIKVDNIEHNAMLSCLNTSVFISCIIICKFKQNPIKKIALN